MGFDGIFAFDLLVRLQTSYTRIIKWRYRRERYILTSNWSATGWSFVRKPKQAAYFFILYPIIFLFSIDNRSASKLLPLKIIRVIAVSKIGQYFFLFSIKKNIYLDFSMNSSASKLLYYLIIYNKIKYLHVNYIREYIEPDIWPQKPLSIYKSPPCVQ